MRHYFFNKATAVDLGKQVVIEGLKAAKSYQFVGKGVGTIGASVEIAYSNNGADFFVYRTETLTGTNSFNVFHMHSDIWHFVRLTIKTIVAGTELTVVVGTQA